MSKNTSDNGINDARKTCYCITCARYFHPLGIMGHRAGHLNRGEECTIEFTNGNARTYRPRSDAPVEIATEEVPQGAEALVEHGNHDATSRATGGTVPVLTPPYKSSAIQTIVLSAACPVNLLTVRDTRQVAPT